MIPKIIHYCWFGRNPKPELAEKCINSWKKHCPDYEIIEWNEDNYSISEAPLYVQQAYEAKKWAFVTDFARLNIIYHHGGIYLDTDVELIECLDSFLYNNSFFGTDGKYINTGLGFGAEKESPILTELMQDYLQIPFILNDNVYDSVPCPIRNTNVFIQKGYEYDNTDHYLDRIHIYPAEVFCPINQATGRMSITDKTVAIHWFAGSWIDPEQRKQQSKAMLLGKIIGIDRAWIILGVLDGIKREGVIDYFREHVIKRYNT